MHRSPASPLTRPLADAVTQGRGSGARYALSSSLAFIGDSRVALGQGRYFDASSADWKGLNVSGGTVGYAVTSTAATGTLEYRAADQNFRWTAPGDTAGPWVAGQAGILTLESATAHKELRLGLRALSDAPVADQTVTVTISGSYSYRYRAQGFGVWAAHFLRWLNASPKMLGISGNSTGNLAEQLAFLQSNASGVGYDVILAGTNDVSAGTATATTTANLQALYDARRALGRRLVLVNEPARWKPSLSGTPMTSAQQTAHAAINDFIATYAATYGCLLVDAYTATVDNGFADRRPASGMLKDDVHFADKGAQAVGLLVAQAIGGVAGYGVARSTSTGSLLTNSLFTGTSGFASTATTGTIATGWTVARTAGNHSNVASIEARSEGGNWQKVVFSGATAEGSTSVYVSTQPTLAALGVAVGDEVYFEAEVIGESLSAVEAIEVRGVFTNATADPAMETSSTLRNDANSRLVDFRATLRTPLQRIPEGCTTISPQVRCQMASGATGTLKVGAFVLVKP